MAPWLESMLDIVDPGPRSLPSHLPVFCDGISDISIEFAFMDEDPAPLDHTEDDVPDSPLPDPEMLRWRNGTPVAPERRRSSSSGSLTATGQHIRRLRAASEWKTVTSSRTN